MKLCTSTNEETRNIINIKARPEKFFVANMVVSIVAIFENRFYTVCEFVWKPYWKRWRRTGNILFHVVVSCVALSFGFLAPDQETAKRNMFAKLRCLPQYIYEENNLVLCEDYTYHVVCLVTIVSIASAMTVSFPVLLVWNAVVQRRSRTMSQKTFQLQKAFLIALVIQISLPICLIALPAIYLFISLMLYYYNRALTNFAVCLLSMHGFMSSMAMKLVHRPYREALLSFFKKTVAVGSAENSFKRLLRYHREVSIGVVIT